MMRLRHVVPAVALAFGAPALGQLNNLDEALRTTPITAERLGDGLHGLFGVGAAMVVSIGEQGVLAVDDQLPEMAPKNTEKLREPGGGDMAIEFNTHGHFTPACWRKASGPAGTWNVAHATSRRVVRQDNVMNP